MIDRDAPTLVPCPACADCVSCGGGGQVMCFACTPPHALSCAYCDACGVCDGTQLTSVESAHTFRSSYPPKRF